MNKLTAEVARMDIGHLKSFQANPHVGLSLKEEKYLQALEIALPVLEQHCDYFGALVLKARESAVKAMAKFPQPNYVLLKVAEEAGEVVQAGVHYAEKRMSWDELEGEVVQLMAMLFRLVTEGDQVNGITPPQPQPSTTLQIDNDGGEL